MKVVRFRFKYALIAGAISVVGYLVFGFMDAGNGVSAEMAAVDATYASSIVFLIIPVLVVVLTLRGSGLFTSLRACQRT